jgi:hypothetical protein
VAQHVAHDHDRFVAEPAKRGRHWPSLAADKRSVTSLIPMNTAPPFVEILVPIGSVPS